MTFNIWKLKLNACVCVFLVLNSFHTIKGCKVFDGSNTEIDYDRAQSIDIADRVDNKQLFKYTVEDVIAVVASEEPTPKYITYDYDSTAQTVTVSVTDEFDNWEVNEFSSTAIFARVEITLDLQCADTSREVSFVGRITQYTNNYEPEFIMVDGETGYELTLPMPLGADYVLAGGCGMTIQVRDYDFKDTYYISSLEFETSGEMGIKASATMGSDKYFDVSLVTTETIHIETPTTIQLIVKDVSPAETPGSVLTSSVSLTINPNITASTPLSPVFEEALYTLEVDTGFVAISSPLKLKFIEGYNKDDTTFDFVHGTGEDLSTYFTVDNYEDYIEVIQKIPFDGEILDANHGVLILQATRNGNTRRGKTVIHISLPGSVLTTTTSTTGTPCSTLPITTECPTLPTTTECPTLPTTTECPTLPTTTECPTPTPEECSTIITSTCEPCTTEAVTECPTPTPEECSTIITSTCEPSTTDAVTECPTPTPEECSTVISCTCEPSTTEAVTECPTPTPEDCSTVISCTCEPCSETTTTIEPTECPNTCTECPSTTPGDSTCPTECPNTCTECPSTTPGDSNCPTECPNTCPETPSSTTPGEITQCPPCSTSEGTIPTDVSTSSSTSTTTASPSIYFKEDAITIFVYKEITGAIGLLTAFSIEEITYSILEETAKENFAVDPSTGELNITESVTSDTVITVVATTTSGESARAKVTVKVITLSLCEDNGTIDASWNYVLMTKSVNEDESAQSYATCGQGFACEIIDSFPSGVDKDYFTVEGQSIKAVTPIDYDNRTLFPSPEHTEIVLEIKATRISSYLTSPVALKPEKKNAFDFIGNIEPDKSSMVMKLMLSIENVDDNPPEYNFNSPVTVGYPNEEIVGMILPPYLIKVEAKDKDLGENTKLNYIIEPNTQFDIEQETGVVYPKPEVFRYEAATFTITVEGQRDDYDGLQVNVVILDEEHIFVIKAENKLLEDVDDILEKLEASTGYTIKSLSAALIIGEDSSKTSSDDNNEENYGILNKIGIFRHKNRSITRASTSYVHLVVYGLNNNKLVASDEIIKSLNGNDDVKAETWSRAEATGIGSDDSDGSDGAVIALAVVASLLAIGLTAFAALYIRLRRNQNTGVKSAPTGISSLQDRYPDYDVEKKNPLSDVQASTSTSIYDIPYEEAASTSQSADVVKPEHNAWTILKDFDDSVSDEYKNSINKDDVPKNQDNDYENLNMGDRRNSDTSFRNDNDSDTGSINGRKKSVVTFNQNVERIEIE